MFFRALFLCFSCLLSLLHGYAQDIPAALPKQILQAQRLETPIKVDGQLDEQLALYFPGPEAGTSHYWLQYSPQPLQPALEPSQVWVGYDDVGLYIVARLYDSAPDSILKQLTERDRRGNADWFAVSINSYQDGINAFNFIVTPANVQVDSRFSADSDDTPLVAMLSGDVSWDGVWQSATTIDSLGWLVEMRIPFSALRFPEAAVQTWDINFARQIRRIRQESFWNPVNPSLQRPSTQMGKLQGLENIKAPLRLQLSPFLTWAIVNEYRPGVNPRNRFENSFGGGMDLKYGINDAFTLDMTLVPDFSNARSDDQVINLTANELFFQENRAFFTEGVELFNKGDFFYSRRVGSSPQNYGRAFAELQAGELVLDNPTQSQLVNASKVSGRLENGLGIGVFNATEAATFATIGQPDGSNTRRVQTSALSNYSVLVFDQNLPNNSFATLVNTAVLRSGSSYDAFLTGGVWDLRTPNNEYGLSGKAALSQQYGISNAEVAPTNRFGHTYNLLFERLTGNWRFGTSYNEESDQYDPNDLGFLFFNNERTAEAYVDRNWFEPFSIFNSGIVSLWTGYSRLYAPSRYSRSWLGTDGRFTTRKFFTFGFEVFSELTPTREFQDTRTPGLALEMPTWGEANGWISTDYRKPFAIDAGGGLGRFYRDASTNTWSFRISPRVRLGDKVMLIARNSINRNQRFLGYVGHAAQGADYYGLGKLFTPTHQSLNTSGVGYSDLAPNSIVMSYRSIRSNDAELNAQLSFTANVIFNLRIRHYWARVRHDEFFQIDETNPLPQPTPYTGNNQAGEALYDFSYNAFNIDGFFRWRFAAGSDLFVSYKTQSFFEGEFRRGPAQNFALLPNQDMLHSLTFKLVYWLDWAELRQQLRQA